MTHRTLRRATSQGSEQTSGSGLPRRALLVLSMLAVLSSNCSGRSATIELSIVTPPDEQFLDQVVRVRLTSSSPMIVVEDERGPDGSFDLAFDLPVTGGQSTVTLEGFDASGTLIAFGRTLPLPLALLDAQVSLFVAPPLSITRAQVDLEPARSEVGAASLAFGAVLAGGRRADGSLSSALHVYNGFTHDFQTGEDLPAARASLTTMVGATEYIYFFGGVDPDGDESATGWRFATSVPPRGDYSNMTSPQGLARAGAQSATQPNDTFVVTGDPAVVINGSSGQISAYEGAPALAGTATTLLLDDIFYNVFLGNGNQDSSGYVLAGGVFTPIEATALDRIGHGTVALSESGQTLTLGGELASTGVLDPSGVLVDVRSLEVEEVPDLLATARRDAALAASSGWVIIAGGVDVSGRVLDDAEVFDAETLERVAALPLLVPRTQASAVALRNGQVLIIGGLDESGQPISEIEIFTPSP